MPALTEHPAAPEFADVTCPFCGLACDDLRIRVSGGVVDVLTPVKTACKKFFDAASFRDGAPRAAVTVGGRPATLEEAAAAAAKLLREANLPVIAGLATDVAGARAVMRLADRSGAVVDHMNSNSMFRNLHVVQDSGWLAATLAEVRNRGDLIVLVGARLFELFPRLDERVLLPDKAMFQAGERDLVLIGPWDAGQLPQRLQDNGFELFRTELSAVGNLMATLRALLAGAGPQAASVGGIDMSVLRRLAERLKRARYSVIAWAAGELDFPHAELTVQSMSDLVRDLNTETRSVALPLGGTQGDMTFNQVCTWQSGFPVRTSFQRRVPDFDPLRNDYRRLLDRGEADALLWLSSLTPERPPETNVATIVLGHPALGDYPFNGIFIPIAIPGIDHAGLRYRTDNVTSLPLKRIRESPWPAAALVIDRISSLL